MRERRSARVGTVSGLALLAGGTAVAAVAGGAHSVFATVLLGMLAVGMGHALLTEIQRQARRGSIGGWASQDTINTVLLASWSAGALTATLLAVAPDSVRAVGLLLTLGYALSCAYFVVERYRTISDSQPTPGPSTHTPSTHTPSTASPPGPAHTAPPAQPRAERAELRAIAPATARSATAREMEARSITKRNPPAMSLGPHASASQPKDPDVHLHETASTEPV